MSKAQPRKEKQKLATLYPTIIRLIKDACNNRFSTYLCILYLPPWTNSPIFLCYQQSQKREHLFSRVLAQSHYRLIMRLEHKWLNIHHQSVCAFFLSPQRCPECLIGLVHTSLWAHLLQSHLEIFLTQLFKSSVCKTLLKSHCCLDFRCFERLRDDLFDIPFYKKRHTLKG